MRLDDDEDTGRGWLWAGAVMVVINLGIVVFTTFSIATDVMDDPPERGISIAVERQNYNAL